MGYLQVELYSEVLHKTVFVNVVIPWKGQTKIKTADQDETEQKYQTLWLLHGASDDHTTWQRETSIERYAAHFGVAVVMPAVQLSSYMNMAHGGRFYDYVSEELPEVMRNMFPLSDRREGNYIAGNSMGGFGAMKIGINNPDKYAAIGCLSAGMRTGKAQMNGGTLFSEEDLKRRIEMSYGGTDLSGTLEDTYYMAEKNKNKSLLPRIYHTIGKDDFLLQDALKMREFFLNMNGNPYQYVYEEYEGSHGWEYWDEHIVDFLDFIYN